MISSNGLTKLESTGEPRESSRELSAEQLRFVTGLSGKFSSTSIERDSHLSGFYDVCRVIGLTGTQGVLIPEANVRHLILRRDVIDAVAQGRFHIYPVRTIDEGLSLLTDQIEPRGAESVNEAASRRLRELAIGLKEFAAPAHNGVNESKNETQRINS